MKIGYPCINRGIGCTSGRTFRLKSYSEERMISSVSDNLMCLERILAWNLEHRIRFFRITSDIIPFASHPICICPWREHFRDRLEEIGEFSSRAEIRISMHPDQFIVLNSPDEKVVSRSIDELMYHTALLDSMNLDGTAKIQLHVGGVYGDAKAAISRFIGVYERLDPALQSRLVIENDDQRFTASDCLEIHEETTIPILFDVFHHTCHNTGERADEMLKLTGKTWKKNDGIPMVDYSSQHQEKRLGSHAEHIDSDDFRRFLAISIPHDIDIMLEIKDKEKSALEAITIAESDPRFIGSS
ncbi:MAG TPA: UV DNA damage repair endonuclease UvsE [Methanospirillum sp.]|uniref:UV DNA damage repair endonuclease UvsE n=1 Tax=Methanospirillum sp. TaxID=45200 RepID=UPI002C237AC3|nr:UV DNA damage repair endonuclease UvsE [Methanospirillum sp.]HWQ63993.1 UV DNA damage repair endonuclease UvsE [Methanospirillum sp.]